jgi:hypothetical protein
MDCEESFFVKASIAFIQKSFSRAGCILFTKFDSDKGGLA